MIRLNKEKTQLITDKYNIRNWQNNDNNEKKVKWNIYSGEKWIIEQ